MALINKLALNTYYTKWILKYDDYAHKMAKPVLCIDR